MAKRQQLFSQIFNFFFPCFISIFLHRHCQPFSCFFAVLQAFVDFSSGIERGGVVLSPDDFARLLEGMTFSPEGHDDLTSQGFGECFPLADDGFGGDPHNLGGGGKKGGCVVDYHIFRLF